ncbi:hypothetical protein EMPG_09982, partial [Blastomyces silverae]
GGRGENRNEDSEDGKSSNPGPNLQVGTTAFRSGSCWTPRNSRVVAYQIHFRFPLPASSFRFQLHH